MSAFDGTSRRRRIYLRGPLEERLMAHTRPGPGECREWRGAITRDGYGLIWRGDGRRQHVYAHRAAYEAAHGPIPDDRKVIRTCDNKLCVNVQHMALKSPKSL